MKYVLVTGAYGGMGKSTVKTLVKRGYTVFALDTQVGENERGVIPLQADVTDEKSIISAYEKVCTVAQDLCAIIHFAGIYMLDSLVEIDCERMQKAFDVNVLGAYIVNKTFLPLLKSDSRIIITTSELANIAALPFTGIYAVTKSALDKYAYSLRMEVQLLGIKVSVLRAGAVDTGMLGASTEALDRFTNSTKLYSCNAKRFKHIVDKVEARRISPQKIADKTLKILGKKNPKFAYSINRNPLLVLFNILPQRMQFWIIKKVLK